MLVRNSVVGPTCFISKAGVFFPPAVIDGFANTNLSAHLRHGDTRVDLAQGEHNLGLRKIGLLYGIVWSFNM